MEYTKVVLAGDARGRVSISALDEKDTGHGYRLAGPKYVEDYARGIKTPQTFRVELGDRDVVELHSYLRIWDEIHLGDDLSEWGSLVEASDRYRRATTDLARVRKYPNFPTERLAQLEEARVKAWARLVQCAAALASVG